nr:hypothetical protein [Tanacetum cinerariifolium]
GRPRALSTSMTTSSSSLLKEGRRSVQRVHVRDSEAFENTEDLPQPGELCWRTHQRGRLQTSEAYRLIKLFRHSRPLSDDLVAYVNGLKHNFISISELCDANYKVLSPKLKYQPPQSFVTQQLPQRSNEDNQLEMAKLIKNNRILLNNNIFPHEETSMGVLLAKGRIVKLIQAWDEKQIKSWSFPELLLQLLNDSRTIDEMLKQRVKQHKQYQPKEIQGLIRKLLEDVQNINEELSDYTNSPSWNPLMIDDDEEHFIQFRLYLENSSKTIAPVLPTKEPEYSLIPSESEVTFDYESECDVPVNDESSPIFTTFSNPLFDCNDDFSSCNDESLSNEDVPKENFKIYSSPLFDDEEIISNPYHFAESDLIESLLNRDTLIDSSPKFDYLLEEFSGELAHIDPIPPGIKEADFDLEEEIRLVENFLYDNSSPRPSKELNAKIVDTIAEFLSPYLIPVEDGDSYMEEIDLFLATDDLMPLGIENDEYESEGDIYFLEEMFSNDLIPLPENESFNFDHYDESSFPRPPPEPPDVEVFFDFKPDSGELISAVMNNIDELIEDECFDPGGGEIDVFANVEDNDYFPFIFVIRIFLPYLIYPEVSPLLLSTGSEDTIFDPSSPLRADGIS